MKVRALAQILFLAGVCAVCVFPGDSSAHPVSYRWPDEAIFSDRYRVFVGMGDRTDSEVQVLMSPALQGGLPGTGAGGAYLFLCSSVSGPVARPADNPDREDIWRRFRGCIHKSPELRHQGQLGTEWQRGDLSGRQAVQVHLCQFFG